MKSTLLIFPVESEENFESYSLLRSFGIRILGSSSILTSYSEVDEFVPLPFITASDFLTEFRKVISEQNVTHFYTSHAGVWGLINNYLQQSDLNINLIMCSEFPFKKEWERLSPAVQWARAVSFSLDVSKSEVDNAPVLTEAELSSLYKFYFAIPGQSDATKLEALVAITPLIPQGDWVEIGSLYGRSSFALGWLANRYTQSSLFCVDPWDEILVKPQGGRASVLDNQIGDIDSEQIFRVFLSSIGILNNVTFFKKTSAEAINDYHQRVNTPESTRGDAGIAFLHVDGNHHYDEVSRDIGLWEPYVDVGGWIAIDDYLWAFGDGPKKAGDELLATNRFDTAFVTGDTLYIRKEYM
ncbi:class I SAM-dependent methyltransferase [Neptuniibacter sp. 2_MG-2023]|uniref:class I SAM-dependent methyltransferase n=1 Tax=Neptuniibacter sp. 2_MG-2023 TaxID=3062671 RepID=UPI0026E2F218|nr:class I SAM-dependent methyltransferase [Neptuniibacter sp. 2_MG-2023]MDO6514528.1 class I SAM-dependent methyltransferase [Neptuniibacter sp. 2_MG-2023]